MELNELSYAEAKLACDEIHVHPMNPNRNVKLEL